MFFRLLCVIFFLTTHQSFSQKILALDKGGRAKRIRYFPGDVITFKTNGSSNFISGKIENISDSVTIEGRNYGTGEFTRIKVFPARYLEQMLVSGAVYLPAAGALFITGEAVSSALKKDYPLVEKNQLNLAGGLILGGLLLYGLSSRTFTVGKNHPLKILDLTIN